MWIPTTEELQQAAKAGTLIEGSHFEFKRQVENGAGANKELAKDLASLAISGGTLIIGIVDERHRDPTDSSSAFHPVPLAGLAERVEQVALTRCEPPLTVIMRTIEIASAPGTGYLVVHVPPSSVAPHMVDGRYWGRGDRTKRQLSNADVVALHDQRRMFDQDAESALNSYVVRDPYAESGRIQELAHLFFVAVPRPGRPGMLYAALDHQGSHQTQLFHLLNKRQNEDPGFGTWSPDINSAGRWSRRDDGWAATSYELTAGRDLEDGAHEKEVLEIELGEDGEVRLFCGRGSDVLRYDQGLKVVIEQLTAGLVYRAVRITSDVAAMSGYFGDWALGVELNGIRGSESHAVAVGMFGSAQPYPADTYRSLTRASTPELEHHAGVVTERLIGRVFRTLGSYQIDKLDLLFGRVKT